MKIFGKCMENYGKCGEITENFGKCMENVEKLREIMENYGKCMENYCLGILYRSMSLYLVVIMENVMKCI